VGQAVGDGAGFEDRIDWPKIRHEDRASGGWSRWAALVVPAPVARRRQRSRRVVRPDRRVPRRQDRRGLVGFPRPQRQGV